MPCSVPANRKPGPLRIFADDVDIIVVRDAVDDFGPRDAVVVSAIGVGTAVVSLIVFRGEVGRAGLVRRGVDDADADEIRQALGRDVLPILSAVASDVDQAVVRAGPDGVDVLGRGGDGEDGRVDFGAVLVLGDGAAGIAERFRIGAWSDPG